MIRSLCGREGHGRVKGGGKGKNDEAMTNERQSKLGAGP